MTRSNACFNAYASNLRVRRASVRRLSRVGHLVSRPSANNPGFVGCAVIYRSGATRTLILQVMQSVAFALTADNEIPHTISMTHKCTMSSISITLRPLMFLLPLNQMQRPHLFGFFASLLKLSVTAPSSPSPENENPASQCDEQTDNRRRQNDPSPGA